MREHYSLDRLIEYGTEPVPEERAGQEGGSRFVSVACPPP